MELYHNELNMGYIGSVMSYLTHLPIRVDQDPTLDLAIHCVAFTLKGFIEHDFTEAKFEMTDTKLLVAYCQALNGLQRALQDPQRSKSATVLCITKLLMLFEVRCKVNTLFNYSNLAGSVFGGQHAWKTWSGTNVVLLCSFNTVDQVDLRRSLKSVF